MRGEKKKKRTERERERERITLKYIKKVFAPKNGGPTAATDRARGPMVFFFGFGLSFFFVLFCFFIFSFSYKSKTPSNTCAVRVPVTDCCSRR